MRAMPLALPICSTRSTGRKSTPRSRLAVHTTAFSSPRFRPASTHSRTSRSSEPWCSATTPAQSGRASIRFWYHSSACGRVLVNTSVEPYWSISSTTGCSIVRPRWPAHGKRDGFAGTSVSMTICFFSPPSTMTPASAASTPSSTLRASSRLPIVADTPHTTSPGFQRRSRASASCTCTPRLLPISSCHSSMTIMSRCLNWSRAPAWESSSDRLSGVVIRAPGSDFDCRARSAEPVSPVRAPTVQAPIVSGAMAPSSAADVSSERCVSAASARIGVIHSTRRPLFARRLRFAPRSSAANQTAYVLPAPVLACSRPDCPASAAFHTARWNGNTFQPRAANQSSMLCSACERVMPRPRARR